MLPPFRIPLGLLLSLCLPIAAFGTEGDGGPAIRLEGAGIDEIRELAVDTALSRGWVVTSTDEGGIQFEQTIATPAPDQRGTAYALIRVRAEFAADGEDILVHLRAVQIDGPGTGVERSQDVTERYQDNLMNALRALQGRWEASLTVPDRPSPPPLPEAGALAGERSLGTWAYYAEQLAVTLGCRLGPEGAELVSAGADVEIHRVPCQGSQSMLIRCHFGECRPAY